MIVVHEIVIFEGWTAPLDKVTVVVGGVSQVTDRVGDAGPKPTPFIAKTLNF